eukprot:6197414-Pleurochrysis_carterae.AAC.5
MLISWRLPRRLSKILRTTQRGSLHKQHRRRAPRAAFVREPFAPQPASTCPIGFASPFLAGRRRRTARASTASSWRRWKASSTHLRRATRDRTRRRSRSCDSAAQRQRSSHSRRAL